MSERIKAIRDAMATLGEHASRHPGSQLCHAISVIELVLSRMGLLSDSAHGVSVFVADDQRRWELTERVDIEVLTMVNGEQAFASTPMRIETTDGGWPVIVDGNGLAKLGHPHEGVIKGRILPVIDVVEGKP